MNSVPHFDLLAEVQKYISTASPKQVLHDIAAAEFELLRGAGDPVAGVVGSGSTLTPDFNWMYSAFSGTTLALGSSVMSVQLGAAKPVAVLETEPLAA